jgi:hypothetical protein
MSDKTYDTIKNVALIVAPVITFIGALVSIWNLPYTAEITASLAAIDTLAGAVVLVAKKIYEDKQKGAK